MEQPFPKYALFNGKLHIFVKQIEPIPGAKRQAIVICSCAANSDEASDERYVEESAWLEAACEFKQTAQKAGLVTSQSSAQEKITLFRSLFRGRPDVHAHGFRKKDGGIGYVPACANEWKRGTCPRAESPKAKCSLCSKQAFLPLTDSATSLASTYSAMAQPLRSLSWTSTRTVGKTPSPPSARLRNPAACKPA